MRVFITGGTGFVGSYFCDRLVGSGHDVTVLSRSRPRRSMARERVRFVVGDPVVPGAWQGEVSSHDAVINLAGASIFRYWTQKAKRTILDSRVLTTRHVVDALKDEGSGKLLIGCSAVGYYGGHLDDRVLDESSPPGEDFLAQVGVVWEKEALRAQGAGVRVVISRFGIVMGRDGGALAQMLPSAKYCMGAPLGSGRQWVSWIHLEDLYRIMVFAMEKPDLSGPFNCVAPNPVQNREMTKILARSLHRGAFLPGAPAFAMRLALGEFAEVLLKGQRVVPKRLLEAGFEFHYSTLREALENLLQGTPG